MEHNCNGIENGYEIFLLDTTWVLAHKFDRVYIEHIKFCPWCGAKLEDEK